MKKVRKITSIMLMLTMMVSLLSGFSMTAYAAEFAEDTIVEAEAGNLSAGALKTKDSDASGGQCIVTKNTGEGRIDDPSVVSKPDASYTFNLTKDGTYYVYALYYAENDGVDSFHWWWNDMPHSTKHPATTVPFQWYEMGSATLKAGKNTLNIVHREFGSKFDAIFVTSNPANAPTSSGGSAPTPAPSASAAPTTAPTSAPGKVDTDGAVLFKTTDGSVMFEAEDTVIDKELVTILPEKDTSAGKIVRMQIANKEGVAVDAKGAMSFNIEADKSGTYSVWLRYVAAHQGADSAWISNNGAEFKDTTITVNSSGDESDYTWKSIATISGASAGSKFNIRIVPRETGAKLDKFIVTCIPGYTPEGMGELPVPGAKPEVKLLPEMYPKPAITPPADHPRVLFRPDDIAAIKANMTHEQNAEAYKNFEAAKEREVTGILADKKGNYDGNVFAIITAKAFDYAINGNEENGKQAIAALLNVLETENFDQQYETRFIGNLLYVSAQVYDWCYPLLDEDQKLTIIAGCEAKAPRMEIKYPPSHQSAIGSHASEAQLARDLVSFGIATYNERPDIYNFVAGRYLSEFVPVREFWYPSHTQHQGSSYGAYRWGWDLMATVLFKQMSGQDIYKNDDIFQTGYEFIYLRRPDGQTFRIGDDYNEEGGKGSYWEKYRYMMFWASNYNKDPYLKREFQREAKHMAGFSSDHNNNLTFVDQLIFNDVNLNGRPLGELPLTRYFGSPNGLMIARTGWNDGYKSPDVMALMNIEEHNGGNHDHLDSGNFQIYYKGPLASESGFYDAYFTNHDINYNKDSIAHNVLLIYDPSEQQGRYMNTVATGGQKWIKGEAQTFDEWMNHEQYTRAKVIGHEYGPDPIKPEYSYIKGDLTIGYTKKVDEVLRSMLFMPLEDPDHPAAFFVMDKVTSVNPEFKKTWLLHMQQEPQINGNVTTIVRDEGEYNGKLVNETLLPKDAKIEKIGGDGKRYWIHDKDYPFEETVPDTKAVEYGWGRVEVSPGSANKTDYFLNVMTVKDADNTAADLKSTLIEGDSYVGAAISNKAAIFAKDANRLEQSLSFNVPGSGELDILVAGIKEGTWTVTSAAGEQEAIATADGGVIYFTAPAGDITVTYKDTNAVRPEITPVITELEGVSIKIKNMFLYTDVPPTIREGRTLVPVRAIFEALDAEVSYDEATATATATKEFRTIQITENSNIAYVDGQEFTLDVPAIIENGRFLVPVRFVSEALNAKVEWDQHAQIVYITPGRLIPLGEDETEGYAKIAKATASAVSEMHIAERSYDNDYTTLWSAEGEHYVIYELDEEYTVTAVEIMLNQNRNRNALFEVQYSTDGVNFTSLYDGAGDGMVGDYVWEKFEFKEPVKAKYMKYIAKGSEISMWNGLLEIRFAVQ